MTATECNDRYNAAVSHLTLILMSGRINTHALVHCLTIDLSKLTGYMRDANSPLAPYCHEYPISEK